MSSKNPGNSRRIGIQSALGRALQRGKSSADSAMSALSKIWSTRKGGDNSKRVRAK